VGAGLLPERILYAEKSTGKGWPKEAREEKDLHAPPRRNPFDIVFVNVD